VSADCSIRASAVTSAAVATSVLPDSRGEEVAYSRSAGVVTALVLAGRAFSASAQVGSAGPTVTLGVRLSGDEQGHERTAGAVPHSRPERYSTRCCC
jgi:hypothetical protein